MVICSTLESTYLYFYIGILFPGYDECQIYWFSIDCKLNDEAVCFEKKCFAKVYAVDFKYHLQDIPIRHPQVSDVSEMYLQPL